MAKNIETIGIGAVISVFILLLFLPDISFADTPAWATKANTALQEILTGLKWLVRVAASIILIWKIVELIGGKPFRELMPWFIGATLFAMSTEIVALFFGS